MYTFNIIGDEILDGQSSYTSYIIDRINENGEVISPDFDELLKNVEIGSEYTLDNVIYADGKNSVCVLVTRENKQFVVRTLVTTESGSVMVDGAFTRALPVGDGKMLLWEQSGIDVLEVSTK